MLSAASAFLGRWINDVWLVEPRAIEPCLPKISGAEHGREPFEDQG